MTYIFIFITHLFIILLVPHNLFLELYFFLIVLYCMYTYGLLVRNKHNILYNVLGVSMLENM